MPYIFLAFSNKKKNSSEKTMIVLSVEKSLIYYFSLFEKKTSKENKGPIIHYNAAQSS